MAKKGLEMTLVQAQAHAAKHGYALDGHPPDAVTGASESKRAGGALPKPVKMTRPEKEYGMILEAMKRKGEIVDYRFQGMSLPWGADPVTGRQMRYKCDWLVIEAIGPLWHAGQFVVLKLIEVKGAHIWKDDRTRFKGCRAEWPMFQFEMHQLTRGEWRRIQ